MAIHENCEGLRRRDCLKLGLGALLGGAGGVLSGALFGVLWAASHGGAWADGFGWARHILAAGVTAGAVAGAAGAILDAEEFPFRSDGRAVQFPVADQAASSPATDLGRPALPAMWVSPQCTSDTSTGWRSSPLAVSRYS